MCESLPQDMRPMVVSAFQNAQALTTQQQVQAKQEPLAEGTLQESYAPVEGFSAFLNASPSRSCMTTVSDGLEQEKVTKIVLDCSLAQF